MGRSAIVGAVIVMVLAGCGGAPSSSEPQAATPGMPDAQASAACIPLACMKISPSDPRPSFAVATAGSDETDSLSTHCVGAATCNDVTADKPVCVQYVTSGGIQLSLFACPLVCCQ